MAEQILQKLNILEDQTKLLLTQREKVNSLLNGRRKRSLIAPLTFDFQLEFEQPSAQSTLKTVSSITEDKSCDSRKQNRYMSFRSELDHKKSHFEKSNLRPHFVSMKAKKQENKLTERLQPVNENLNSRSIRPFLYLKDTSEEENHLCELYSHNGPAGRKSGGSSVFSPARNFRSDAYRKERDSTLFRAPAKNKPTVAFDAVGHLEDRVNKRKTSPSQMKDFNIKESKSRNCQLSKHGSIRKQNLLPLCFEDELKKLNAKIINVNRPKTAISQMKPNYTDPIIFHETRDVQMLLLTKNKFPLCPIGNENIYKHKRRNFVLERNCGIFRSLNSGQCSTPPNLKRTVLVAWRKNAQPPPSEVKCRVAEDKSKRKNNELVSENTNWNKPSNFSQTFSSLTKNSAGFFDKSVIQEKNTKTGKFERVFSTRKPMNSHKFSESTVKSSSRPFKNILPVHKLSTITPLDDLLNLSSITNA